ncbi:MAG: oligosaccharide flippase family protein [bacterium]|nr:oligosaccharide flippase family protein [bacterium]
MKVARNTFFLYLSFFLSAVLGFLQIKILSLYLSPNELGTFFTLSAFGQLISGILLLGIPFVLVRYLPKFHAMNDRKKLSSLFISLSGCYFLITILVYIILFFSGYRLGLFIYKDITIGASLSFSYIAFSVVAYFTLIFTAFNGLRKMHYSTLLNLFYLLSLTLLIFLFRNYLSSHVLLMIYMFASSISIVLGLVLLFNQIKCVSFNPTSSLKEILPYWKYAIFLGLLVSLSCFLDRLIIGYFLGMQFVAMFAMADKVNSFARRILDIPLEAASPEITYYWERGEKSVLGQKLELLIKILFVISIIFVIIILTGGKLILRTISTQAYSGAFSTVCFLGISILLSAVYAPISTAMRATGKIVFNLISSIIWVLVYIMCVTILIQKFQIAGVGMAYLIATFATLIYNLVWVAQQHTSLKFNPIFFYKIIGTGVIIGLITYFTFRIPYFSDHKIELIVLSSFVTMAYGLFLFNPSLFSSLEKQQMRSLFKSFLP